MQEAILKFISSIPDGIYLLIIANYLSMITDFLVGSFIAFFKKDIIFKSQIGIYGILRKMLSMVIMVLFVFIGLLFGDIGKGAVYLLLLGYLFFECWSIYEHYKVIEYTRANLLLPIINIIKKMLEDRGK